MCYCCIMYAIKEIVKKNCGQIEHHTIMTGTRFNWALYKAIRWTTLFQNPKGNGKKKFEIVEFWNHQESVKFVTINHFLINTVLMKKDTDVIKILTIIICRINQQILIHWKIFFNCNWITQLEFLSETLHVSQVL